MGEQDPIQPTLHPFVNVSQQAGPDAFGAAGQGNTVCAPVCAQAFRDLTAQLPRQVRSHFETSFSNVFSNVFLKPVLFYLDGRAR